MCRDSYFFIVNRLLAPQINKAINSVQKDLTTLKDIDSMMKLGAYHPMGPLSLGDLIRLHHGNATSGLRRSGPGIAPEVCLIRLDSLGRDKSDWAAPKTYSVGQEAQDALALLDHLKIARAAIIGSSRGGLLGLVIAATAKDRLAGL